MDDRIRTLAEKLWNYHQLNHELARADAILVLCSHDTAVAVRGAELFLAGWAPLLIFSGGLGAITRHLWHEPEADKFAAIAIDSGVPRDRILIENQSTNTGENVLLTNSCSPTGASTHRRSFSCRSRTWSGAAMRPSNVTGRRKR